MVVVLLQFGADPNAITNAGLTPLAAAVICYLERFPGQIKYQSHFMVLRREGNEPGTWHRAEIEWKIGKHVKDANPVSGNQGLGDDNAENNENGKSVVCQCS